jgi:hypothetical protein
MLGTIKSRSPVNHQKQMQASQCQLSKKLLQQLINKLPVDGTLDDWKNQAGLLSTKEENTSLSLSFPSAKKIIRYPHQVERLRKLRVLMRQQVSDSVAII